MRTTSKTRWGLLLAALGLSLAANANNGSTPAAATEGASRVVAVSAGGYHSCGLKADAGIQCWGEGGTYSYFDYGQADDRPGPFVQVATGEFHTCGLKPDGSVECWGGNFAPMPNNDGPFVAISAGYNHTCGLKADGQAVCWGVAADDYGQSQSRTGPYVAVSAGSFHTCALKPDGNVECWGRNISGEAPATVTGPFVSISAGMFHTCGLDANGVATCWGDDSHGQSTIPAGYGPFVAVSAGEYHSCGLRPGGDVQCWGAGGGDYGQAANMPGPFVSVSAGGFHTCAQKADGNAQCWGWDGHNQVTLPTDLGILGFGQIATGNAHACQVRRDGSLGCWGLDDEGQVGGAPAGPYDQVVAGDAHSCAIGTNGKVSCWGRNGQNLTVALGYGTWRQLAPAPNGALCALTTSSAHYSRCVRGASAWDFGYAFTNITHDRNAPDGSPNLCGVNLYYAADGYCNQGFDATHVGQFAGPWLRLESGLNHQCGLSVDGSLHCWGDDSLGQTDAVPTGKFRAFSAGWNHACAIRENGTLACWGSNLNGQADAPAGTYVQVAAGNTFSCAIRSDGVRMCWGNDSHGQAPQLALSPTTLAGGTAGTAYTGTSLGLVDASPSANAEEAYVPQGAAFAVTGGSLPTGLSLSAAGVLSGTPTAGGNFTFTVEGEDANGFAGAREYTIAIVGDVTPPSISYVLNPASPDGSNGWYVGNVGIDWTLGDAQSAITSSTGCEDNPNALTSDTQGATFTCTATSAGGSNSVTTASIKRDATAPTLAPTVPSPLLRGQAYVASANASDATSLLATQGCGALDTGTTGNKSTTCSAMDNAGNTKTVTLNYTVTTTCANDGYKGTQLTWCRNICEMGYTGSTRDIWIHRWTDKYRDLPYCLAQAPAQPQ